MPVYEYQCEQCSREVTEFFKLSDYRSEVECVCTGRAVRKLSLPAVVGDYAGYESPVTGKWIEGRRAHREELVRTGCRVYEKGETQDFHRKLAKRKEEYERNVERVVDLAARDLMK